MYNLLSPPYLFRHAPQIDVGTGDFMPGPDLGGQSFDALEASSGAPTEQTVAGCYVVPLVDDPDGWTVLERIVLFPYSSAPPPPLLSDIRPPDDFVITMRSSYAFSSLSEFQSAVTTRRQQLGEPMPCLVSKGKRFGDLVTNFPNLNQGMSTWDIYQGTTVVGIGIIARKSASLTSQHWVLFSDSLPFDDLRCVRRTQSIPSLQAFFTDVQSLRNNSSVPFQHAVEECTHHADLPW